MLARSLQPSLPPSFLPRLSTKSIKSNIVRPSLGGRKKAGNRSGTKCCRRCYEKNVHRYDLWGGAANEVLIGKAIPWVFVSLLSLCSTMFFKDWWKSGHNSSRWKHPGKLCTSMCRKLGNMVGSLHSCYAFLARGPLSGKDALVCSHIQRQRCLYARKFATVACGVAVLVFGLVSIRFYSVFYSDVEREPWDFSDAMILRGIEVFPVVFCSFVLMALAWMMPTPTPPALDLG